MGYWWNGLKFEKNCVPPQDVKSHNLKVNKPEIVTINILWWNTILFKFQSVPPVPTVHSSLDLGRTGYISYHRLNSYGQKRNYNSTTAFFSLLTANVLPLFNCILEVSNFRTTKTITH